MTSQYSFDFDHHSRFSGARNYRGQMCEQGGPYYQSQSDYVDEQNDEEVSKQYFKKLDMFRKLDLVSQHNAVYYKKLEEIRKLDQVRLRFVRQSLQKRQM